MFSENNIRSIIIEAANLGLKLRVNNGKLLARGDWNKIDVELKSIIRNKKQEIINVLNNLTALKNVTSISKRTLSRNLTSFAQQRLWLLDKIDDGSAHYNMPGTLRLTGDLNVCALTDALSTIIERHESLRTYFTEDDDGQPLQVIRPASAIEVPITDISFLPVDEREFDLAELVAEEASKPFDLSNQSSHDLMLRAQLVKVEDQAHVLLVTMHHIASDGWSIAILINEFSALYQAYVQGEDNPLPELAIQYADYAHWQRDWLQGEVLDAQLGYWKTQLAALPVVHSLPLDKARPKIQTFKGASHKSDISSSTTDKLNTLCQGVGGTLFMGLHAAFSVLLSRYSNETDIVVGSPIANREQSEVARLIGFFVNTLVLRCDLSNNPSFTELLKQSKTTLLDAYAHQQVPFEQLVEILQPERSIAHSPLFQVMLVLQNNEEGELELPGLTLSQVPQSADIAKYDLTLAITETPQGLQLSWEYNTDLFNDETILRLAKHFGLLLTGLVNQPEENVFSIDMLSKEETHQQLIEWNDTAADFPKDKCIHELFEQQVEQTPDAIALVFEDQQLTYRELNQQANQLAHYLVNEKNIIPDTPIGICLARSVEMVVAILGILKAGGAYVPLDPDYPEARLAYMLEDAALDTVLTTQDVLARSLATSTQALCLDDAQSKQQLSAQPITNIAVLRLKLTATHLAYVIYTSGSTGQPKGVMVEHHSLVNLTAAEIRDFEIHKNDRVLHLISFNFDPGTGVLFSAINAGATLYFSSARENITAFIKKHEITHASFPSALLMAQSKPNMSLPELKVIATGGEACSIGVINAWAKNRTYFNLYGPTESTITAVRDKCKDFVRESLIGKPLDNVKCYVLSESRKLLPIGAEGELYIGGEGVSRGYLNMADLTADKFILNPFSDDSDDLLYKTDDMVRWSPNGKLEYLGRIDDQVKIRGFRIELGEIENTLLTHDSIKEAVVVAHEGETGDKRLVAYMVAKQAIYTKKLLISAEFELWRQYLNQTLPEYMVPSAFVLLEAIPLTSNGKVDRKALPAPDISQLQDVYIAPSSEIEKALCDIWQDVLGLEQVGITDNFFQLGGNSLSITKVATLIRQKLMFEVPIKTLFEIQTIQSLAASLIVIETHSTEECTQEQEMESFEL